MSKTKFVELTNIYSQRKEILSIDDRQGKVVNKSVFHIKFATITYAMLEIKQMIILLLLCLYKQLKTEIDFK